jgi:class 3 adenylate cyclase
MLFGDVKGYSKLTDVEVPVFFKLVLGAFARVLKPYGNKVLHKNTWGDALYLVFDDAGLAARCALQLQDEMAAIDRAAAGLPADMGLRIGGHLGPTFAGIDPVIDKPAFFGAHVSRAARVEPVTPVGSIYVTEAFAAILALHNADEFACDYVGITQAAKHYKPPMRMFALRRRAPH